MTSLSKTNTKVSAIVDRIHPSPIFQLNHKITQMNLQGEDIIDLSLGEPDLPTPSWIGEAAIEAIRRGDTKYPPIAGSVALRQAIQRYYQTRHNLGYELSQMIVGNGAKQVLFNAFMATLDHGDRVVLPAPYWASYQDIVQCAGGVCDEVICPEAQGFKITPQQLEDAIGPTTRWVILNSPQNPTGAVYTAEEWESLGTVLARHPHVLILCDDIYDAICYNKMPAASLLDIVPHLYDRVLIVNGVSKTFAMTGWRVGYGLGPPWLIQAMMTLQSQSTSGVCSIAQAAATAALESHQSYEHKDVQTYVAIYQQRRDDMVQSFQKSALLSCTPPSGAFYLYANCSALIKRIPGVSTDQEAATWILDHAKVGCVPGVVFGLSPYLRFSYAIETPRLHQALERLSRAFKALS